MKLKDVKILVKSGEKDFSGGWVGRVQLLSQDTANERSGLFSFPVFGDYLGARPRDPAFVSSAFRRGPAWNFL
ncbi:uncharacterized protein LAESUDRAFT_725258 [Laetiporus sulphureus 93-53]|uniref:Uncharacterized protein n=1 Tax=Laetiporus sulphureus 93-53 TaxID=1314785 RepID=A0A165EM26_9APHY|nr:uncharacterized protein LAESUDRAFT_725258 [Laetiporus sulphureus 93-53]KZT07342.1 hypothetical protein LAESUDRAFT_725258 [Laetiporus sulphureus 93-53]